MEETKRDVGFQRMAVVLTRLCVPSRVLGLQKTVLLSVVFAGGACFLGFQIIGVTSWVLSGMISWMCLYAIAWFFQFRDPYLAQTVTGFFLAVSSNAAATPRSRGWHTLSALIARRYECGGIGRVRLRRSGRSGR